MPIIDDNGFYPDENRAFVTPDALGADGDIAVHLPNDADPALLTGAFDRLTLIEIPFPSAADGRGFSLARRLRDLGYRGRLRARGHLIPDQYAYARRCGFDEVAIDEALAARMPEAQWRRAAALATPPFVRRRAG